MNTAARMESTGVPRRIQLSEETAELLIAAGKEDWVRRREELGAFTHVSTDSKTGQTFFLQCFPFVCSRSDGKGKRW